MSLTQTTPATPPSPSFIHLILFDRGSGHEDEANSEDIFYLEVPIDIAHAACLYPRKYLRYLGWCVLGLEGVLVDKNGCEVSLESLLLDRGIYRYAVSESTPDGDPLARAVDLEVINFKERSGDESESVPSGYSGASDITASSQSTTCKDFVSRLVARDGWCVWTGLNGRGMHIVPYRRGNEWLQLLVNNRPHSEDEKLAHTDVTL